MARTEYAIAMWTGIDAWEKEDLDGRRQMCRRLGWPLQYAEGPADHEWLTDEQYDQLLTCEVE